jgi:hypothetical protein
LNVFFNATLASNVELNKPTGLSFHSDVSVYEDIVLSYFSEFYAGNKDQRINRHIKLVHFHFRFDFNIDIYSLKNYNCGNCFEVCS